MPRLGDPHRDHPRQALLQALEIPPQRRPVGQQLHHRGAGRRGPPVRDELDHRGVALVADRGDERRAAAEDRLGDAALVEGGEILDRAAAAGHADRLDPQRPRGAIDRGDGAGDLACGLLPLHPHRHHHQADRRAALARDAAAIREGGAAGGGHHGDAPREARQVALAGVVEPAEPPQLGAEAPERLLERAETARGDRVDLQLRAPLRRPVGDGGAHLDRVPLGRRRLEGARDRPPHDAADARVGVPQREVEVPVASPQVRHLADDPQAVGQRRERRRDPAAQRLDADRFAARGRGRRRFGIARRRRRRILACGARGAVRPRTGPGGRSGLLEEPPLLGSAGERWIEGAAGHDRIVRVAAGGPSAASPAADAPPRCLPPPRRCA